MSGAISLREAREQINRVRAQYELAKNKVESEQAELQKGKEVSQDSGRAVCVTQNVSEGIQQHAHSQIAKIVNRCLEAVFGDIYDFTIDFRQSRGRTEAHLLLRSRLSSSDGQEFDPLESVGGGVVDVLGFALRLSALMLSVPKKRRFLALDEPMKMLSREYRPKMRELLEALCREFDIQILMVTHHQDLLSGKIVEIS